MGREREFFERERVCGRVRECVGERVWEKESESVGERERGRESVGERAWERARAWERGMGERGERERECRRGRESLCRRG